MNIHHFRFCYSSFISFCSAVFREYRILIYGFWFAQDTCRIIWSEKVFYFGVLRHCGSSRIDLWTVLLLMMASSFQGCNGKFNQPHRRMEMTFELEINRKCKNAAWQRKWQAKIDGERKTFYHVEDYLFVCCDTKWQRTPWGRHSVVTSWDKSFAILWAPPHGIITMAALQVPVNQINSRMACAGSSLLSLAIRRHYITQWHVIQSSCNFPSQSFVQKRSQTELQMTRQSNVSAVKTAASLISLMTNRIDSVTFYCVGDSQFTLRGKRTLRAQWDKPRFNESSDTCHSAVSIAQPIGSPPIRASQTHIYHIRQWI